MSRSKLTITAEIFTIIATLLVAAGIVVGVNVYTMINLADKTTNEIRKYVKDAAETITESQEELERARPHYNLVVGFFDPNAKEDPQIKNEITLKLGQTQLLDIRIWNITTQKDDDDSELATRRADDVSCIIEFPSSIGVGRPFTLQPNAYTQHVDQYGGGYIVGIDYGDEYALHQGTNFVFRVNATPYEKGDWSIKVTADTNNPNSLEPAYQEELVIHVE